MRLLSHGEASALLECQAQHAFRYTGALTGGVALRPKAIKPVLREGRAWGRGVAHLHQHGDLTGAGEQIIASLTEDAIELRRHGLYDHDEHEQIGAKLLLCLEHYAASTEPLPITDPERELLVPIPSRGGVRRSNAYRLQCFLDGVHTDADGRVWIVEYKLRGRLSSFEQIALSRQTRWYAWAWREAAGTEPTGIIVDERLNAAPSAVAVNQDGRLSKRQGCTVQAYVDAGGVDPDVIDALRAKVWQHRHPLVLRPGELDEVERQLVSIAQQVNDFDTGARYPVRNPSPMRCPGCAFKDICADPTDQALVDAFHTRVPAKRNRTKEESLA